MDWEFPVNHDCCFCNTEIENNLDFKLLTSKARIGKFLYCNILPELSVTKIIKKVCLKCHDVIQTKKCDILKSGPTNDIIIGKSDSDVRKWKVENIRKSLLSHFPNSQFKGLSSEFGADPKKCSEQPPCRNTRGRSRTKPDIVFSKLKTPVSRSTNNYDKNPPTHLKNENSKILTNEGSPKSGQNIGAEKCADVSLPISRKSNYARLVSTERDKQSLNGSAESENAENNCQKSPRVNRLKIKDIARPPASWCKNQPTNSRRKMISSPLLYSDNAVDGSDESFITSLENSFSDSYISRFCDEFLKAYEKDHSCDSYEILASLYSRDESSTQLISESNEGSKCQSEVKRFWVNVVHADGVQRTGYEEICNSKKGADLNSESGQYPSEKMESRNFVRGLFPSTNSASSEKNAPCENNRLPEWPERSASDGSALLKSGQNLNYDECEMQVPVSNCHAPGNSTKDKYFPKLNFFTKCNIYGGNDLSLYSTSTSYSLASDNTSLECAENANRVIGSQHRSRSNKPRSSTLESKKHSKTAGYDSNLNTPSVSPCNSCQSSNDAFINPTHSKKCHSSGTQDKRRLKKSQNDESYCDENANYSAFQSSTNISHIPSGTPYDFNQPTNDQLDTFQYSPNVFHPSNELQAQYNISTDQQSGELKSQFNANIIGQSKKHRLNISQNQPGLNALDASVNCANNDPRFVSDSSKNAYKICNDSCHNFEKSYVEDKLSMSNHLKDICKSVLFSDASVSSIVDVTDTFSDISFSDISNSNDLFVDMLTKDWSFNSEKKDTKSHLVEVADASENEIKSEDGKFKEDKLVAKVNFWNDNILSSSDNNQQICQKYKEYPVAPNSENDNCVIEMKPADQYIANNNSLRQIEELNSSSVIKRIGYSRKSKTSENGSDNREFGIIFSEKVEVDGCDISEFEVKEIDEESHAENEDCFSVYAKGKSKARKTFGDTIKTEGEDSKDQSPRKRGRPKGSTNKGYVNKKKIIIADDMNCLMCQKEYNNFSDFATHCFTYHCTREVGDNERFNCAYCCKKFHDPFEFAKHFGRHNFDSKFSAILFAFCPLCSLSNFELYGFKSREEFGNHVNESHRDFTKNENGCNLCDDAISSDLQNNNQIDHLLRKHCLTDILVKPKYIRCVLCNGQYGTQDKMCNHVCPKLTSNVCGICGVNLPSKKRLTFHMQLHREESEQIFARCEQCFVFLNKEEKSYDHIRFSHEKNFYPCLFCQEVFKARIGLVLHMKYHTGKRRFSCEECGKAFLNKTTLREHEVSHLKVKPFQCHICGGCVSRKSRLRAHIQAHVSKSSNILQMCFVCQQCNCVHATARENAQHQKRIHGEKTKLDKIKLQKVFLCEYCEECFADAESLNAHRENQHWKNKQEIIYTCRVCRNEFATYSRLATHKLTHGLNYDSAIRSQSEANHDDTPQKELIIPKYFCCKVCDKTFLRFTVYSFHRKNAKHAYDSRNLLSGGDDENPNWRKVEENRNYGCEVCKKKFVSEKSLEKHSQMHRDGGTLQIFVCVRCGKSFRSKAAYKFHEKAHFANTPYKCDKCGKEFLHVSGYRTHLRRHTYNGRYLCQYCGRKFDHPSERDNHLRSHTGERPYSCNECGKKFITRQTWLQHKKTHLNFQRYNCKICGKGFLRQGSCYMHERNESCVPKFYECENCHQPFDRKYSLKQHVASCVKVYSRTNSEEDCAICPLCEMKLSFKGPDDRSNVVDEHIRLRHSGLITRF